MTSLLLYSRISICYSHPCNLSHFVEPMKLFVSFDGSYSNTVEDHFIDLSRTIRFCIWCKYYVGVISHCHHHKEKCHPRKPKSNAYSSSSSNHFITFSNMQLFTFSIGCKYYVYVISHWYKVSSSTRQPESITHRRHELYMHWQYLHCKHSVRTSTKEVKAMIKQKVDTKLI